MPYMTEPLTLAEQWRVCQWHAELRAVGCTASPADLYSKCECGQWKLRWLEHCRRCHGKRRYRASDYDRIFGTDEELDRAADLKPKSVVQPISPSGRVSAVTANYDKEQGNRATTT